MTYIYSKADFIRFIETQVKDSEVIVFSNSATQATHSKKNGIKITHQYASTAFKDEGIGHIVFQETSILGVLITDKKRLTKDALQAMENAKKEKQPA